MLMSALPCRAVRETTFHSSAFRGRSLASLALVALLGCARVGSTPPVDAGPPAADTGTPPPPPPPVIDAGPAPTDTTVSVDVPLSRPPMPWGAERIDPSAPANAPTLFGGSETMAARPAIAYPLDGSLHPVNITDIAVQWRGMSATATTYRLRFTNAAGTLNVYTSCAKIDCVYPMPVDQWRAMADANRDADVTFTVAAAGNGATVPTSMPVRLRFSPSAVAGGLYYWSTRQQGFFRLAFGQSKAVPYAPDATCHGCHSVSRNGKRIAWVPNQADDGISATAIAVAATDTMPVAPVSYAGSSTAPALNSDGTRLLVKDDGALTVYNTDTRAVVTTGKPEGLSPDRDLLFFEWSPDGKTIAATMGAAPSRPGNALYFESSEIALIPFDGTSFGKLRTLVPSTAEINYYPSWSPDGKWIVFSTSEATGVSVPLLLGTYDNFKGRLRLIAATGGRIYELANASRPGQYNTSWPKFAPFSQLDGNLLFIGFSSKGSYGVLKDNDPLKNAQLWLSAVDLRRLAQGDPSWAPIWLPFQELTQSNHLPYWTEAIGCLTNADCGVDGVCKNRVCVPTLVIP
jgi:hypothetical protein